MDITQIATTVVSAALSVTAVSAFLIKNLPKITKYSRIAASAINLIDDVLEALEDGNMTAQEADKVKAAVEKLKADLAK